MQLHLQRCPHIPGCSEKWEMLEWIKVTGIISQIQRIRYTAVMTQFWLGWWCVPNELKGRICAGGHRHFRSDAWGFVYRVLGSSTFEAPPGPHGWHNGPILLPAPYGKLPSRAPTTCPLASLRRLNQRAARHLCSSQQHEVVVDNFASFPHSV